MERSPRTNFGKTDGVRFGFQIRKQSDWKFERKGGMEAMG